MVGVMTQFSSQNNGVIIICMLTRRQPICIITSRAPNIENNNHACSFFQKFGCPMAAKFSSCSFIGDFFFIILARLSFCFFPPQI